MRTPGSAVPKARFYVSLTTDDYERLVRLQQITGTYSHTETIRDAIRYTLEHLIDEKANDPRGAPAAT